MDKGLIHIYCGNGKGKTTAATGLAVRAAGAGRRVLIARFLKTSHSAELKAFTYIPGITVLPLEKEFGFLRTMSPEVRKEAEAYYTAYFDRAVRRAVQEHYDMLVLDEINAAVSNGMVRAESLAEFLKQKPEWMEVILTGRDPVPQILELADYISEIRNIRHPFDRGIPAREGIEY